MTRTFDIRAASPADMAGAGSMQHACWMHAYRGLLDDAFLAQLSPEGIAGYHARHFTSSGEHAQPRMPFLVADWPGRANPIAGFVRGGPTRAASAAGDPVPQHVIRNFPFELFAIHVAHDLHRSGVGRALFGAFAKEAKKLGETSLVLWVLTNNAPAIAFYRALGGQPVAESVLTLGGKAYPQTAYAWSDLAPLTCVRNTSPRRRQR
ncbi:MAG: GNAT family N-acetyltransferase [Planctomycetes bacterium]|nr:GNAT family N-acetyltransferase [Planctomycetota bacterium]